MSDETKDTRLPPPAFPPGSRRHIHANSGSPSANDSHPKATEGGAFISPDDPIPPRKETVDRAFISSDEPIPVRESDAVFDAFISPDDPIPPRVPRLDPEEGIVTGMGDDPHMEPEELVAGGDPYVLEVAGAVERLAAALKKKGEAGLRATPQMSRLEATLRAYCVGYVAGRRAEDQAEQSDYEPFDGIDIEG